MIEMVDKNMKTMPEVVRRRKNVSSSGELFGKSEGVKRDCSNMASAQPSTSLELNDSASGNRNSAKAKHNRCKPQKNNTEKYEKKKISEVKSAFFRSNQKKFENEEKKVLNVEVNKDIFLSAVDTFENILHDLAEDDRDEEVYVRLLEVQNKIETELSSFRISNEMKDFQNLRLSKSVSSSMQSLCSATSNLKDFDGSDTIKEFMSRVNCPFCSKEEPNKVELIKHLDENCLQLKLNVFKKNVLPYAVGQILPNSTLKCNVCQNSVHRHLGQFLIHSETESHKKTYVKIAGTKKFTDFLFCSVCKILVPDNYTQFHHHITHRIHIERSKFPPVKFNNYVKRGINCVYTRSKTFKCLVCTLPQNFKNPKDVLKHFESVQHKYSVLPKFFCEFCNDNIHIYEVLSHFISEEHKIKEQLSEEVYELCSYCAFTCTSLSILATHMTNECQEINQIRIQIQNLTKVEVNVNDSNRKENLNAAEGEKNKAEKKLENESSDEVKITGDKTKETSSIIIKGNTGLPELYKYFKTFGEIITLELCKGENVVIEFRERRAVEDILSLQGLIKINGEKVEILTDENLIKSDEKRKEAKQPKGSEASSSHSAQQANLGDEIKLRNNDNDLKHISRDSEINRLFSSVSSHLHERTQGNNGIIVQKIFRDCPKVFGIESYSLVGFIACGLSFPVENINLYCKMSDGLKNVVSLDVLSALNGAIHYQKNLIKNLGKFFQSTDWEGVCYSVDGDYPYLESKHRITQKTCTFTCTESVKVLTDMLSHCTERSSVKRFCLIIRFWLSVHELKIREFEYVVISILVFFLLNQKWMKPFEPRPVSSYDVRMFHEAVNEKVGAVEEITSLPDCCTVRELFIHFLNFLLKFDFEKDAICLPITRPVPKALFETAPFASYLEFLDPSDLINSSMCVLDPHLKANLASGINAKDLKSFLETARENYR